MTKVTQSNGQLRVGVSKYPVLGASSSNRSWEAEDFQQKVAEQIAEMYCNEPAEGGLQNSDEMDLQDDPIEAPDDSQPLSVEPPLTLSKICSKLTAVERLWLVRIVKAHGKEVVLARWPAYEVHINYVRCLR